MFDIFIIVRFVQFEKEPYPILVTLSGIVTEVRLVQFRNASSPMLVTLFGIETFFFAYGILISLLLSLLYNTPSNDEYTALFSSTI